MTMVPDDDRRANHEKCSRLQATVAQISTDYRLSSREAQILIFAVEGVPRRHIAEVLGVSENTVKTQVRSLLDKLGKETLSEAVWWVRSTVETPTMSGPWQ